MLVHVNATEQFKNNKKGVAMLEELCKKAYRMDSVIFIRKPKTLTLVLKKQWFDLMVTGEKDKEFRGPTDWIKSRLYNKDGSTKEYDYIKFINGYQANAPYFICKYEGFGTGYGNTYTFKSNPNISLHVTQEQYVIFLGEIIERGNIK